MKPSPSFLTHLFARLGRALQSLQATLRDWLPRPAPVLRPIPIRIEHQPRDAVRRQRDPRHLHSIHNHPPGA